MKRVTSGSTSRIDLREQVLSFPSQPVITKDNVTIDIDAVLYYRIADPQKAAYAIQNLPFALETLTRTTLRNIVGDIELDQTLASRDMINKRMREVIEEASIGWGVDVTRVELQAIEPPRDIQQSMELQMRAERERRAAVTNAEASKRAAILEAEGVQQSQVSRAQGESEAAVLRAKGLADRAARDGGGRGAGDRAHRRLAPRGPGRDVPARHEVSRGAPAAHAGQGLDDFPPRRGRGRDGCARRHQGAARALVERCPAIAGAPRQPAPRHTPPRPQIPPRSRTHRRRRPLLHPAARGRKVAVARITRERAERIARGHACENCGEYSYKKLVVKPASKEEREGVDVAWIASKTCGVCGAVHEMGIDAEGEIIYVALSASAAPARNGASVPSFGAGSMPSSRASRSYTSTFGNSAIVDPGAKIRPAREEERAHVRHRVVVAVLAAWPYGFACRQPIIQPSSATPTIGVMRGLVP